MDVFSDALLAVPIGLFPCRRWNTYFQSVMHSNKLAIGKYSRAMSLMMLLAVSGVLVLLISSACIIVMFVLIFHGVVAMGMPL